MQTLNGEEQEKCKTSLGLKIFKFFETLKDRKGNLLRWVCLGLF